MKEKEKQRIIKLFHEAIKHDNRMFQKVKVCHRYWNSGQYDTLFYTQVGSPVKSVFTIISDSSKIRIIRYLCGKTLQSVIDCNKEEDLQKLVSFIDNYLVRVCDLSVMEYSEVKIDNIFESKKIEDTNNLLEFIRKHKIEPNDIYDAPLTPINNLEIEKTLK